MTSNFLIFLNRFKKNHDFLNKILKKLNIILGRSEKRVSPAHFSLTRSSHLPKWVGSIRLISFPFSLSSFLLPLPSLPPPLFFPYFLSSFSIRHFLLFYTIPTFSSSFQQIKKKKKGIKKGREVRETDDFMRSIFVVEIPLKKKRENGLAFLLCIVLFLLLLFECPLRQ